jgi:hypothetical protein
MKGNKSAHQKDSKSSAHQKTQAFKTRLSCHIKYATPSQRRVLSNVMKGNAVYHPGPIKGKGSAHQTDSNN